MSEKPELSMCKKVGLLTDKFCRPTDLVALISFQVFRHGDRRKYVIRLIIVTLVMIHLRPLWRRLGAALRASLGL